MKRHLSTVAKGSQYELQVMQLLSHYSFNLIRVGSSGDKGIDLRGRWLLTKENHWVDVVVQCKNYKKPVGPCSLRELESVSKYAIGVLSSPCDFTRGNKLTLRKFHFLGTIQAMHDSDRPLILTRIEDGKLLSFRGNQSLFRTLPLLSISTDLHTKRIHIYYESHTLSLK